MQIGNFYYIKYKISDLRANQILKQIQPAKLRKKFNILVIDDDEFPLLQDLQNHEFCITYKDEISDLKDVEAYQIILCDINGVGKFLGSESDGAYLAYQIKKRYSDKVVISYTADNTSINSQKYLNCVDKIMSKGTPIEDWASLLDEVIEDFTSPIIAWDRIVKTLIKAMVPLKDIAVLEHKYVKAITKNNLKNLEDLCENSSDNISVVLKNSLVLIIDVLKSIL